MATTWKDSTPVAAPAPQPKISPDRTDVRFNAVWTAPRTQAYVAEVLQAGHWSGDGRMTDRCTALLESEIGCSRAILTTSCTHALEMSALLCGVEPGDEVIIPSFTFVSTANAFALRGAKITFADIRDDTLNLDERQLPGLVTPRTKAIVPVHYGGVACEMDTILDVARRHGVRVIEDNAHGLLGKYRGRPLGTLGALATQSFHETKNFTCGEGGALLINDPELVERAEIILDKGTDRRRFFRGEVDKYSWVDLGSSYTPSEVLAALLLAQLEARETIQSVRQAAWNAYATELADWARQRGFRLPTVPAGCEHPAHIFYIRVTDLDERTRFIAHLKERGVWSVFHYVPLHTSAMGRRFGARPGDCPVTERASDQLVRLPLHALLTPADIDRVVAACQAF